ncbi:hypothetical protein [Sulfobacillus sp. hq2]|uniref:CN hydrolase domain-containing protein n=1 Tax=Sulfobacillus thermotolerans TaxID=338644 RepID=A0ABN5H3C8_9FIRM|nr:hypothetical protein [Sulfobacillus sp. hq2]AUW95188.1 hypothetical protein BXT84_15490 [Sulfobacillus thermotolerans]POB10157.1 hypothetical protein CO251_11335 [Sulfobacillus sp. hq2]
MASIDLFAVQPYMTLNDYQNASKFYHKLDQLFAALLPMTSHEVPALVVLPEDLATFLVIADHLETVMQAKTMNEAFTKLGQRKALALALTMARYRTRSLRQAFFLLHAPKVWEIWYGAIVQLARRYHVYISAGSALLPADRNHWRTPLLNPASHHIYNVSFTVNPLGEIIHTTQKVNLVPTQEDVLDLSPGGIEQALKTYDIGGIPCATAICYDAFRIPHTENEPGFSPILPRLDAMGAQIVAQPSANPWPWDEPFPFQPGHLRRDQWRQEGAYSMLSTFHNISVVVNPQLLFSALDIHFDGQSTIYGRTINGPTILAQSPHYHAQPSSEDIIHTRWITE